MGAVHTAPTWFGDRFVSLPTALTASGVMVLVFAVARSLSAPSLDVTDAGLPAAAAASFVAPVPALAPLPRTEAASSALVPQDSSAKLDSLTALGTIVAPLAARHHRIWVDGEVVVWSTGPTLSVPCGTHVVRIGSSGASQSVQVPCGGTVMLAPSGPSAAKNPDAR